MAKSCIKINLVDGACSQQKDMQVGRVMFGMCSVGHLIYVVGGVDPNTYDSTETCEVFNVLSGNWNSTASTPDHYTSGITTISAQKRYILTFGGRNNDFETPADNFEYIRRLDCHKENKGWQMLCLQNLQSLKNGYCYGITHLESADNSENVQELLIFGGRGSDRDEMR